MTSPTLPKKKITAKLSHSKIIERKNKIKLGSTKVASRDHWTHLRTMNYRIYTGPSDRPFLLGCKILMGPFL